MTKDDFITRLQENKEISGKNVGLGLLIFFRQCYFLSVGYQLDRKNAIAAMERSCAGIISFGVDDGSLVRDGLVCQSQFEKT